jgi:predicted PurR-regulated permease PerM
MGIPMTNDYSSVSTEDFMRKAVESAIKIGLIFLLVSWCFQIASPFINPLAWGIIIAVALYPVHQSLSAILGDREKLSAVLITTVLLLIILGPCVFLAGILTENIQELTHKFQQEGFSIPEPPEKVAAWPLIGKPIFNFWQLTATNLADSVKQFTPQIKLISKWLIASGASTILAILQLIVSVIISGTLWVYGKGGHHLALAIGKRIAGTQGEELSVLCTSTIRGVARGVLGVALIQTLLAGAAFFVAGIPGAGILTILCLFIAIVQLPTFILFVPCMIYVFSGHDTLFATVFMVWMLGVGFIDNILKPILMGRGLDLPMIIVFIGAIGGMLFSGIIGLFVGAVVLALGYKLFLSWLKGPGVV